MAFGVYFVYFDLKLGTGVHIWPGVGVGTRFVAPAK